MAERAELLVGTKKGLFVLRGERGGPMEVAARRFEGVVVEYASFDPRSGTYHASVTQHFGPKVWLTPDPTGEWEQSDGPAFPEETEATVVRTWVITPGEAPGEVYAGVAPAALFRSDDDGRTWKLNQPLWDDPTRPRWEGGAGGLCLHSIATWPGDPDRLSIGISAVGVWHTDDRGQTWRREVEGLVPPYLPEEARAESLDYCVHNMHRVPMQPERMFMQFHGGVYRTDDNGGKWIDLHRGGITGLPSDFGFPLVVDPHRSDRAFVIPLVADLDRTPPEGKLRVYETADAGRSWSALTQGLPQQGAWHTVLRQAFGHGQDPLGLYFGAESGEVFGSADGGQTWRTVIQHLPPIHSVRVGTA